MIEHEVETGFVESYGVGGCKNADVLQLWSSWRAVAVAIHGEVVHHVDIDDVATFLLYSFGFTSGRKIRDQNRLLGWLRPFYGEWRYVFLSLSWKWALKAHCSD